MRTIEDVKEALKNYEDELKRESGIKRDHYIIMGGNMSVVKRGVGQYALDKGTPIPMIWETAKKKHEEFQEKCGGNIRLEIIKYSDWLTKNIEDCHKLIGCMQKSLAGEETVSTAPTNPPDGIEPESGCDVPEENPAPDETEQVIPGGVFKGPDGTFRAISVTCSDCPYGASSCMICRFATGINMDTFPWEVICSAPGELVKKT